MKIFLLVAVLVGLPVQAEAEFWDGNKLVKLMWEYEDWRDGKTGAHPAKLRRAPTGRPAQSAPWHRLELAPG